MTLNGRVAVVTGGGPRHRRGHLAELAGERGAAVAIAYRDREADARALERAILSGRWTRVDGAV